jgi:hypothetical protein
MDKPDETEKRPGDNGRKGPARVIAALQLAVAVCIVAFGTWQLFRGNLEAAFSTVPFLIIWYLFLTVGKRR